MHEPNSPLLAVIENVHVERCRFVGGDIVLYGDAKFINCYMYGCTIRNPTFFERLRRWWKGPRASEEQRP